ncbi:response regulator [Duganella sp. FT92W]|uniref:Response regulator n=1 Tax=Pseudoduganella rivuli TaxID=2666085 RepID=A0A7X2IPH0_9BURK|nr:response regulator [Pseudoduganella rivuli]MRV73595.1 response regulator [Pseudoduganella rivuli]
MSESHTPAILYVDDEATALKYFQRALEPLAPVLTALSVEEGQALLDQHADRIAVLVSDQRMPGAYGNALLSYARDRYPHIVRILTTAYSELEHTVDAVNQGQIHRYIQKPWDIAALRMELKQALELARLRREHAQLLREKLVVRQQQVIASRVGMVYTLCAGIGGLVSCLPVESYLAAAQLGGVAPPEPDWLLIDHADLTSAEAFRNAAFALAVREHLDEIDQRHADAQPERILSMLEENFGAACSVLGTTGVHFRDGADLAEFLASPSADVISSQHAFWMAALLWLGRHGWTLHIAPGEGGGVQGKLGRSDTMLTPAQLAAWVERF